MIDPRFIRFGLLEASCIVLDPGFDGLGCLSGDGLNIANLGAFIGQRILVIDVLL